MLKFHSLAAPRFYRFRAETLDDAFELARVLGPKFKALAIESYPQDGGVFWTWECLIKVWQCSLDELRQFMRKVPDGHVMRQTVNTPQQFTGERDWSH